MPALGWLLRRARLNRRGSKSGCSDRQALFGDVFRDQPRECDVHPRARYLALLSAGSFLGISARMARMWTTPRERGELPALSCRSSHGGIPGSTS